MKNYTTASGNGCIQWNTIFVRFLWGYGYVGSYGPSLFLIKACLWGPLSRQKDNHLPRVLTSLCFCLGLNRTATSIVVWSTSTRTIHSSKSGLWHIINFVYEKTSTSSELAACVKTDKLPFTCNSEDHRGEFKRSKQYDKSENIIWFVTSRCLIRAPQLDIWYGYYAICKHTVIIMALYW